mgnify:FL=1
MEIQCLANVHEQNVPLILKIWTLQQKMFHSFIGAAAPVTASIFVEPMTFEKIPSAAVP